MIQLCLNLFKDEEIPDLIHEVLSHKDAALSISISGGKDSQAMLAWLVEQRQQYRWNCKFYAIHADLGRIEWKQTPLFVRHLCDRYGVELVVVRRAKGDMIDRWLERRDKLTLQGKLDTPFWSSAKNRYCTTELKVAPIDAYMRQHTVVISAMGMRAQESTNREKKPTLSLRTQICTSRICELSPSLAWSYWGSLPKGRFALNWLPVHSWNLDKVWEWCGHSTSDWMRRRALSDEEALSGWQAHPAYVLGKGNERLSCSFCVLGSLNDLTNAIAYNRETYEILTSMEAESGFSFQHKRFLSDLDK